MNVLKVMVSGSSGMLATALIARLLLEPSVETIYALSSNPQKVEACHSDDGRLIVVDYDAALQILDLKHPDVLIHTAFPRQNDGRSIVEGLNYSLNLLRHVPEDCAVIHISSQSVYNPKRSISAKEENNMEAPDSTYAVAKYASELLVSEICSKSQCAHIRLASLISPQFEDRFINKVIRNGLKQREIKAFGPNNYFGFLDISDAADAIVVMAMTAGTKDWCSIYNLGPHNQGYSLKEIAEKACELLLQRGFPCKLSLDLEHPAASSRLDSSRFEQDFSWKSHKTLDDTINEIIDYQVDRN